MTLWGNTDANTSAPKYAPNYVRISPNANNVNALYGNTTSDVFVTGQTIGLFGVDVNEEQAANTGAPQHAGWVLRKVGSGGRAGRVTYETLVAMGSMVADGDAVFVEYRIVVDSEPSNSALVTGNAVNFIVAAHSVPNTTLTYQWQVDGGPGVQTWSNVANSGLYASANGNATSTLSISNNATLNNNTYRVLIRVAGANDVYSSNAVLTLTS